MRLFLLCFAFTSIGCHREVIKRSALPNIIYILADDLGIGDVSAYNPQSKIATPAIDSLAQNGLLFTDAHSGSSVCTPTRYGVLTGRYAWRTRLEKGVTWTYDEHLIDPHRLTVASMLQSRGYQTSCIGKWHLGLDWAKDSSGNVDFTLPIKNGPRQNGFDYFFGITASLDIPPYFYIENDQITARSIDTIEAMGGKKFWRKSVIGNDFVHEDVLPQLTQKALEVIRRNSSATQPFFLYFPLTAPHTPILPTPPFRGKSKTNEYGDFVMMVDDVVRQIVNAVNQAGISQNTLIVFTSDNGCSPQADFDELKALGHQPSYLYRGHKADIYEGGHRIPLILKWPDGIPEGQKTTQLACLTDLMATISALLEVSLPDSAGEDSYNLLPILKNPTSTLPIRNTIVHHSIDGCFSLRKGPWKICFCPGSGGWSFPTATETAKMNLPPLQLFNLENDPGEEKNVAGEYPQIVDELTNLMMDYIQNGRSTPGTPVENDRVVSFR